MGPGRILVGTESERTDRAANRSGDRDVRIVRPRAAVLSVPYRLADRR